MTEMPWPKEPQPCHVDVYDNGDGWLTYIDPRDKRNTSLPITTGTAAERTMSDGSKIVQWRWRDHGDGTGHVEPSIHRKGVYHSPYRTEWRLTPANPDGTWPATEVDPDGN